MAPGPVKGLLQRLKDNEFILCAEGYQLEFERRGYLNAETFAPEVVLDHPEIVEQVHRDFAHAGSDVMVAFSYTGPKEVTNFIQRGYDPVELNRRALVLAREIADKTGTLMAASIGKSAIFDPTKPENIPKIQDVFKECVKWAVKEKADYIVVETFFFLKEAELCLEAIKLYGEGMPCVITMAAFTGGVTADDVPLEVALKTLEDGGADVVGLNCGAGPVHIIDYMKRVRKTCKGPLACLPVVYRTDPVTNPMMQSMKLPSGQPTYFRNLDYFYATQDDVEEFGRAMKEMDIRYVGLCCGNSPKHFRALAESVGRATPASRYSTKAGKDYFRPDSQTEPNIHNVVAKMTAEPS